MVSLWIPRELKEAPYLDPAIRPPALQPGYALLINPFYPKDPHARFGKHVLTPSLALTSIAGATPPDWQVAYWDENLLQGRCLGSPSRQSWASPSVSHSPSGLTRWPIGTAVEGLA